MSFNFIRFIWSHLIYLIIFLGIFLPSLCSLCLFLVSVALKDLQKFTILMFYLRVGDKICVKVLIYIFTTLYMCSAALHVQTSHLF